MITVNEGNAIGFAIWQQESLQLITANESDTIVLVAW